MHKAAWKLGRKGEREEARQLRQQLQTLPSRDQCRSL
jgi:hypothetical protein